MIFHYFRVFCWINLRLEIEHFSSVSLTRKVWEYVSHASDRLNIGIYIASQTSLRPHQVKSGRFVRVYIVVFIPCSLSSAHQVKSGRFVKIYIMVFIPCPYSRLTKIHARPSRIFWLLKKLDSSLTIICLNNYTYITLVLLNSTAGILKIMKIKITLWIFLQSLSAKFCTSTFLKNVLKIWILYKKKT